MGARVGGRVTLKDGVEVLNIYLWYSRVQGEGGFLTPPPSFLPGLRKICDENNIVLIMDEVGSPSGSL